MAVKIRLRQQGRTNRQTFRLVACDTHVKRDGKYLDNLGWYDPMLAENNAKIDEEKTLQWLDKGAEMTHEAKKLLARVAPHVMKVWNERQEAKKLKMAAKKRASRKNSAAGTAKKAAAPKKPKAAKATAKAAK